MKLEKIIEDVRSVLSEERFNHSLGVMKRAEELAKIYETDTDIAKIVGITHDIAKEMSQEQSLEYLKKNNIELDKVENNNPYLLHGKVGADIVKKKYGFNESMQNAILFHTVGNPNMDMLAKIIYVADKTEENRKSDKINIEFERELSNSDIDKGLIYMIDEMIKMNIDKQKLIHPDSILTRNELLINIKQRIT